MGKIYGVSKMTLVALGFAGKLTVRRLRGIEGMLLSVTRLFVNTCFSFNFPVKKGEHEVVNNLYSFEQ